MSRRSDGSYWEKRRLDLLGQLEKDEERLYKRLEKVYASEIAKLERDIAAYYREYGEDDVIAYRKLLATLSERDRRLLIEQMEEFGKKYPQHAHLMPVRESIYKLNEMEGIQLSMRMQQLRIGAIEEEEVTAHLEKLARRSANLAAEQMGFGTAFYAVDASVVKAVVDVAWAQGESFSQRIWGNRQKLAAYLADDFAKAIARGASYERITKEISDRFDGVSKRNIRRLVYTEGTYVFNESHAKVHEQWYSRYSLSTVTDGRACDQCKDIERATVAEPVNYKDRMPGVNFPPLHPMCRCSETPIVERDAELTLSKDGDPAYDYFGPATESQRKEIREEAKALGVEMRVSADGRSMGYSVASGSNPGGIDMPEDSSYSANLHELDHARYDKENGYPGVVHYLRNPELRIEMERRAYGVEIELARESGYNDLVDELERLRDSEIDRIKEFHGI